ncbi:MAG: P-II family nitrogen regulator, partial [Clostridia bacterium]|nr:P-II family nitrogen regulator [Clostridia bacterium]
MNQLIIAIVNQGYEEKVMEAARGVGARGGTIINGRGTASAQDLVKFMGITLHPNKEIILILSSQSDR